MKRWMSALLAALLLGPVRGLRGIRRSPSGIYYDITRHRPHGDGDDRGRQRDPGPGIFLLDRLQLQLLRVPARHCSPPMA